MGRFYRFGQLALGGGSRQFQAANSYLPAACARRKLILLKVVAKLASTFLLIWLFASPAMACLLPIAQLTQEEKACCRSMSGMCDEMGKNSSHSCCVKVRPHNPSYLIAKAGTSSVQQLPVTPLVFAAFHGSVSAAAMLVSTPTEFGYPPGHSPPSLPDLIVLRI